jgi:hypothetical protein
MKKKTPKAAESLESQVLKNNKTEAVLLTEERRAVYKTVIYTPKKATRYNEERQGALLRFPLRPPAPTKG